MLEPVAQAEVPEEEVAAKPDYDWAPRLERPPLAEAQAQYEPPPPAPRVYEPPPQPRVYEPPPAPRASEEAPQTSEEPAEEQPAEEQPVEEQPAAYEAEPAAPPPPAYTPPPPAPVAAPPSEVAAKSGLNPIVLGLGAVVVVLIAVMGWLLTRDSGGLNDNVGELVVQSRPEGAQVKIDGEVKGVTPLTVRLDKGAHVLEVQSGKSEPRVIPLMIQGGVQTSQYVELSGTAATGSLEIVSQPAGARIIVDGQNRGTTPMTIRDLSPGEHSVVLELRGRKATQTVKIQAGSTSKLSVPIK